MKKVLLVALAALSSSCLSNFALASNPASNSTSSTDANSVAVSNVKAQVEGTFKFESGFLNQSKLVDDEKNVSSGRKKFGFYTDAIVKLTISNTVDDFTYGGRVAIQPTTRASGSTDYTGSHIFVESEYGKVELGSPYDAGSKMRIVAADVTASPGGGWSRYSKLDGKQGSYTLNGVDVPAELLDDEEYFFGSTFKSSLKQINDRTEPSRKISFYTPEMKGFQFGISYIPDSGNTGTSSMNVVSTGITEIDLPLDPATQAVGATKRQIKLNRNVKDSIAAGLSYKTNISDGVDIAIAATFEHGKPSGKAEIIEKDANNNEVKKDKYKLSGLNTYNIGGTLNVGNFSYGASYGTLGKSLTTKEYNKTGRDTRYYNVAMAYGQGPMKTSINYLKTERFKNTVEAVSIGTEYKLAPGFLPYAEISYFQAKGRPSFYPNAPKKKLKGTVALIGAKMKF